MLQLPLLPNGVSSLRTAWTVSLTPPTLRTFTELILSPGEDQHNLVPKRPGPLGANAALQHSVLGSTAAAAAYTSFAFRYGHRVTPASAASWSALFIRSSAKLGLWAGVLGATANWYYHSRFTSVVVSQNNAVKPWKLYERTKSFTVDDGCLVGASVGLAASIPALLVIPRWTRCLGLVNIGASAGILGAHGYLQYTGERQKAYVRLERGFKRRSLELWALFWDVEMMAQFNPLIQLYVRRNALWYSQHPPDTANERVEEHGFDDAEPGELNTNVSTSDGTYEYEDDSYYIPPFDYAEDLKRIDVESTYALIEEHEADIAALLKETEFILFTCAHKQYEYCHLKDADDEERRQRLDELQLLLNTYCKFRSAAEQLQSRLIGWQMSLQHKAILEASTPVDNSIAAWLRKTTHDFTTHNPVLSIQGLGETRVSLGAEVKTFEARIAHSGLEKAKQDDWRLDLENSRSLFRVADKLVWEFEKMQDAARKEGRLGAKKAINHQRGAAETTRVDGTAAPKPPSESLEPGKS